ncbi:MAG: HlyD family efflux transporter periplasmic adaptor subunit [Proteobacteria bacterium]|nr:HlyD family efflux transporter periplasmic adaptor subunit [Pseudomonadota bacterium]
MTNSNSYRILQASLLLVMLLFHPGDGFPAEDNPGIAREATRRSVLTGFTRARATMRIVSQVSDHILEVRGDVGDPIGSDGVFAVIDTTLAELDLQNILLSQKKITSKITYLEKEVARFATLLKQQSTAEAKFDSLEQELDQAKLALENLRNDERKAREMIERHTIRGRAGWQIIQRSVEPGEWVSAGKVLAEIGDFRTLTVPFALSHEEYTRLQKNSAALFLHLPELNTRVAAAIHRVSPGFDQNTRKLNLEIEITDPLPEKRGGIRAELVLETPDPSGAVIVPESALSSRYDTSWVTGLDGEKIPVVKLGPGPTAGTLRISSPRLRPGDRFRLTNPVIESNTGRP